MFNEAWIPFCLDDLPEGESIALDDLDGFVPYLLEKWPDDGTPNRIEMLKPGLRRNPVGVSGWLVFRLPPKPQPVDPEAPTIDWNAIRAARIRDSD